MGRQSAKIYYQGKYHSDALCETDSLSGIPCVTTDGKPTKYINNSQIYLGNKLIWERMPADLIFNSNFICVSNDLVHFSSMQRFIDDSKSDKYFEIISFCTFAGKFVCLAQPHTSDNQTLLLHSDDGFKWKWFYKTDLRFNQGYTNQVFARCKCGGKDCIAVFIRNEIDYFDSDFNLIKTVKTELNPAVDTITFLGGETLYLYGHENRQDYGIMEEYVDGKLTIRHQFSYNESNFLKGYLLYIKEEDSVYSTNSYGRGLGANVYKRGAINSVDGINVSTRNIYFYYPYMSEETIIVRFFVSGEYKYYELKNGKFYFKFATEKPYILYAKRDGVTSYGYFDNEDNEEHMVFTKDNFFGLDFENQEPIKIKGVSTSNAGYTGEFAYIKREGEV